MKVGVENLSKFFVPAIVHYRCGRTSEDIVTQWRDYKTFIKAAFGVSFAWNTHPLLVIAQYIWHGSGGIAVIEMAYEGTVAVVEVKEPEWRFA